MSFVFLFEKRRVGCLGDSPMRDFVQEKVRDLNGLVVPHIRDFRIGREVFDALSEPYLAGHDLEEGLSLVESEWRDKGWRSTVAILGEAATSWSESNRYFDAYKRLVDGISEIHESYEDEDVASISVKPTSLAPVSERAETVFLEDADYRERLEDMVRYAGEHGVNVAQDMEDRRWRTRSIDAAKHVWLEEFDNFGIVLQERLYDTEDDVLNLTDFIDRETSLDHEDVRVRLVAGIYNEPEPHGMPKRVAKKRMPERVQELFEAGFYVQIATHDRKVLDEIVEDIENAGYSSDRFEFQFIRGVPEGKVLADELTSSGYDARFYQPVEIQEGDAIPYMERRLESNPKMLWYGPKAAVKRKFQS